MHPSDDSTLSVFSPCSIKSICNLVETLGTCLVNPGSLKTLSLGICGNGVTEGDEDCDCGSYCARDSCCDGSTCKFKNNAVCDDIDDECCSNCQPKTKGTVCRKSSTPCTLSQTCDGISGVCNQSTILDDGTSCSITKASGTTCASGVCTSRKLQCQGLVGGVYKTVDACQGQGLAGF